jgi:tRNA-uridine 2-sulfurtransferase
VTVIIPKKDNPSKTSAKDRASGPLKVAVGLSGGVDSSVAAYLLKDQGYDVTGVYMQCWEEKADGCKADEDRADAVAVASKLGIKIEHLNFIKPYKDKVIEYFYREYEAGRTPNPDVICNRDIKFGLFMEWAEEKGFDMVATGHYARIEHVKGKYRLLRGVDESKDQSYFLYLLGQEHLAKTLFPLGGMLKNDVRELAKKVGIPTYDKPDSVGICFIGEVDIVDFLKKRLKEVPGEVVNRKGEVLGSHKGVHFYTIGQRRGFEIVKYVGLPLYVVDKDVKNNRLIVGFADEVNKAEFGVSDLHWIAGDPGASFGAEVRVRHLGDLYPASVEIEGESEALVTLDTPVFGVAPGQSAVFYQGEEVLGGGVIEGR